KGCGRERIGRKMQEEKLDDQTIQLALQNYTLDEDRLDSFIAAQGCDLSDPRERKKISDKLFRRGYSWEEIGAALRRCRADSYED
ncbi:MAG: RecX family transcriptional regulator, partial [Clostridia bacterium]|nr:RecX family transcriptional regulator [Clostridia bacterium]